MFVVRRISLWLLAVLAVGVAYVGLTTFEVWRVGLKTGVPATESFDAIVVMGAAQYDGRPSPQLAARLDHVVNLWKARVADTIVVTGGKQTGDRFTEAEASRRYLTDRGVVAAAIVEENSSRSTWEALHNVRALIDASKLDIARIVIVTDPFHSLRTRLIAEENGFDAATSATTSSPVVGTKALEKHLKEGCGVALGRLIGFRRLWKITG